MSIPKKTLQQELAQAEKVWGPLPDSAIASFTSLVSAHRLSVLSGHLLYLNNHWYVTHTGLLSLANRRRCAGIRVWPVRAFCNPGAGRWAFRATAFRSKNCKGFVGYGDADPSNVSSLVRGAEMRVAETRAVNRALRKAYGIGICSVEEMGTMPIQAKSFRTQESAAIAMETVTVAAPKFGTVYANSSASTSSTPNWSRPTPLTSVARRRCEKPAGNRSRTLSSNWPTGPRRTAMRCSASSIVTSAKKKVPRETPDHRPARRRSLCR